MDYEEKLEIIKHIKLGTKEVLYYPYNRGEEPLPLRPISSWELDECFYNSLNEATEKIAGLVIKLKLGQIKGETKIDVSNDGLAKLQKFYDNIDYWIVYFAMKDFQDENFSKPDYDSSNSYPIGFSIVKYMNEVHEIATFVLNATYKSREVVKEIFTDDIGRELAFVLYYCNIPLADITNITPLQRKYLLYSKGHIREVIEGLKKEDGYVVSGQSMTLKEFLEKFK